MYTVDRDGGINEQKRTCNITTSCTFSAAQHIFNTLRRVSCNEALVRFLLSIALSDLQRQVIADRLVDLSKHTH